MLRFKLIPCGMGITVVAIVGAMVLFTVGNAISDDKFKIEQFISPEICSDCHSKIAEQWENSMHNLAHKDPIYNKLSQFLRKGLIDENEIKEADSCVKCHTPVGYVTGFPRKVSDDLSKTAPIATLGIQCDYCHSVVDVKKMYNNGLVLEPGEGEDDPGIKRGPFSDSEPDFHEAQYSKLHTQSNICGTCHDVKHVVFDTPIETTFTEWKNSPYNDSNPENRVTCQGCHMYQRPGVPATGSTNRPENPGSATDYSDERPHIFTHYFVGANANVPPMFNDNTKALMAKARLKNAATISVDKNEPGQKKLKIRVTNSGAGHSIPTGVADLRQVWLEIVIRNKDQKPIFTSGLLNKDRILPENSIVFRIVFGDGNGKPVINIAKAKQVLTDNRIKAKQSVIQTIELPLPLKEGDVISVRLLYRSVSQKILNLIPNETFEPLSVIEMAKIQTKL
ncbi:MAG: cytochrome c family protein [Desulfobacula sp.]|nr:cytochrome c family protein [Desulfobacula sp.]